MNYEINNIAKELIETEEVILSTDKYLYRIYTSTEEGILYDIFSKDSDEDNLDDIELLDGGVYEIFGDLTTETVLEALNFILEE
ncbi:hypothetical protein PT447_00185 [Aliarcobacter butzleri]|uniref:hypothetical protein n=1 Tax=Aliarcobacter butzleri TaxID=28197 RepID=UPI0024DF0369|nr:hypothetical protein [Aliarcobacter butzleri]MDK2063337.1 hypothetical protein [Aliarcobacter butzleri]